MWTGIDEEKEIFKSLCAYYVIHVCTCCGVDIHEREMEERE